MKGYKLTAEQLIPSLKVQIDLVADPKERRKVHNWILGVMESEEQRKERLHNLLETKGRYQIKKTSQRQLKGLKV